MLFKESGGSRRECTPSPPLAHKRSLRDKSLKQSLKAVYQLIVFDLEVGYDIISLTIEYCLKAFDWSHDPRAEGQNALRKDLCRIKKINRCRIRGVAKWYVCEAAGAVFFLEKICLKQVNLLSEMLPDTA